MSVSHPGIHFQRMRPFGATSINALPLLAVHPVLSSIIEGNIVTFSVTRSRNVLGDLTFQYVIISSDSSADFVGSTTGNLDMTSNQLTRTIQATTANRTGTQGDRVIGCTITAISGCQIDPSFAVATTVLKDFVDTGTWFKDLVYRSNQPIAMGPSYFENPPNHWTQYESQCNFVDSFHGDHFGPNNSFIQTWDQIAGGPLNNVSSILNDGQLSWYSQSTHFSVPFLGVPVDKAWVFHNFTVVPIALRTDTGVLADRSAIWDQIVAGTHDQRFIDFGARIAALFTKRGYDLKYYIGCMCPKAQTQAVYRVFGDTRIAFKNACERVYAKMRQGAGLSTMRFCFAPTNFRTYLGEDYGKLEDWMPATCDVIGTAFHPGAFVTNKNKYNQQINGNTNYYGIVGDFMALATAKGLPMAVFEFSPNFNSCPIANDVYGWYYDEFIVPYKDQLVANNTFSNETFNPNAADGQGADAAAQWALGVSTFQTKWGKSTIVPVAVMSITAVVTADQTEGSTLLFNVARNSTTTQACSVTWTVTSSRDITQDITSSTTGTISFVLNDIVVNKQVSVKSADLASTQGSRTITVTLSLPSNCSINAAKKSASNNVIDRTTTAFTTAQKLYLNPFDKQAAHHRPLGAGIIWQMQGGVHPASKGAPGVYRANPGPVFTQGDLSPLVEAYTGLPNSGFFGLFSAHSAGAQGIKYYYFVPDDTTKTKSRHVNLTGTGDEDQLWPLNDELGDYLVHTGLVYPPTPGADNNILLFPKDGNTTNLILSWTNKVINGSDTSTNMQGDTEKTWKIDGADCPFDAPGSATGAGGSGIFWPHGFLRGRELKFTGGHVPYIGHALQATVTRKKNAATEPDTKIIMGEDLMWPAIRRDNSADDPDENTGFLGYGQILAIPKWFRDAETNGVKLRDSTDAHPVTVTGYTGSWALNLTSMGKAIFDALCIYGMRCLDGSGTGVGPGGAYGRIEPRMDQDCFRDKDIYNNIDAELGKICPSRPATGASLTRWKQNLLFPVANIRPYATETEQNANGMYYVGGGGKLYTDSYNTAFNGDNPLY